MCIGAPLSGSVYHNDAGAAEDSDLWVPELELQAVRCHLVWILGFKLGFEYSEKEISIIPLTVNVLKL